MGAKEGKKNKTAEVPKVLSRGGERGWWWGMAGVLKNLPPPPPKNPRERRFGPRTEHSNVKRSGRGGGRDIQKALTDKKKNDSFRHKKKGGKGF